MHVDFKCLISLAECNALSSNFMTYSNDLKSNLLFVNFAQICVVDGVSFVKWRVIFNNKAIYIMIKNSTNNCLFFLQSHICESEHWDKYISVLCFFPLANSKFHYLKKIKTNKLIDSNIGMSNCLKYCDWRNSSNQEKVIINVIPLGHSCALLSPRKIHWYFLYFSPINQDNSSYHSRLLLLLLLFPTQWSSPFDRGHLSKQAETGSKQLNRSVVRWTHCTRSKNTIQGSPIPRNSQSKIFFM